MIKTTKDFWDLANGKALKEFTRDLEEQKAKEPKVVTKKELEQLNKWNRLDH